MAQNKVREMHLALVVVSLSVTRFQFATLCPTLWILFWRQWKVMEGL